MMAFPPFGYPWDLDFTELLETVSSVLQKKIKEQDFVCMWIKKTADFLHQADFE